MEDCLLLQYGMPSLARKTLLQMVATVHRHVSTRAVCRCLRWYLTGCLWLQQDDDSRVRLFAFMSGMIPPPPASHGMVSLCIDEAQDFYFRFLTMIYPVRKISDSMCSVRSSSIGIGDAESLLGTLYPRMLPLDVTEDLMRMSSSAAKGGIVVAVDAFLEFILSKWSDMALGQKVQVKFARNPPLCSLQGFSDRLCAVAAGAAV